MSNRKNKKNKPYCEAISRRQFEATAWGDSRIGCSNYGTVEVIERGVKRLTCSVHSDPKKRYGWN